MNRSKVLHSTALCTYSFQVQYYFNYICLHTHSSPLFGYYYKHHPLQTFLSTKTKQNKLKKKF